MTSEMVIEDLEKLEAVPCVWWLHLEQGSHVDSEERPEHLRVENHGIVEPYIGLETVIAIMSI